MRSQVKSEEPQSGRESTQRLGCSSKQGGGLRSAISERTPWKVHFHVKEKGNAKTPQSCKLSIQDSRAVC